MKIKYLVSIAALVYVVVSLSACEGFISLQGTVYDADTRLPVEGADIKVALNKSVGHPLMLEYDTLSQEEREKMRAQGVKDNYDHYDAKGLREKFPPERMLVDSSK